MQKARGAFGLLGTVACDMMAQAAAALQSQGDALANDCRFPEALHVYRWAACAQPFCIEFIVNLFELFSVCGIASEASRMQGLMALLQSLAAPTPALCRDGADSQCARFLNNILQVHGACANAAPRAAVSSPYS